MLSSSRDKQSDWRASYAITVATIDQVFRIDDEHARFIAAIGGPLSSIMADAAYREWRRLRPRKPRTTKAWGAELVAGLWDKLPRKFLQYIRLALDELEAQDYWRAATRHHS